jgi:uncharacterized membrane protein YfcA
MIGGPPWAYRWGRECLALAKKKDPDWHGYRPAGYGHVRAAGATPPAPGGGDLLGLSGAKLVFAATVSTILGALMTLGIGYFAPTMMVVYLMGMNPKAAFPIMMGAVAFLEPGASAPFIRKKRYNIKSALGLTIGGIPGVLLAFLVKSLPLGTVRWMVIVVVVYTATMMLRSAMRERTRINAVVEPRTALD